MYLANASSPAIRQRMIDGTLGMITTPREGRSPLTAKVWAADNGCFGKGYPGDEAYLDWLAKNSKHANRCLFATAPDVVGDAAATLERSAPFFEPIRAMGYPVAFIAQDGLTSESTPWDSFDVLFVGGTTEFKLGAEARALVAEAKSRGKFVHVGRVNSRKRIRYASLIGADSVDGTYLAFGPDTNLPKLTRWMNEVNTQTNLMGDVSV